MTWPGRSRWPGLRLATRLTVVFVLAAAVVGLAGGVVFARQLFLGLEGGLDTGLRARAQSLTTALGRAPSPAQIQRLVAGTPGLTQILTEGGLVLATSSGAGHLPLLNADQRSRAERGIFIVDGRGRVALAAGESANAVNIRLLGAPIVGTHDLVVLGATRSTVDDAVRDAVVDLVILGTTALALATMGIRSVVGAALKPVEQAREQAERASGRDEQVILPVPSGNDELARLVTTFNELLARQHEALQAERLFTADAGHELRTPLTILAGELELAARPGRSAAELREALAIAREETDRLVRLAEQLLLLARGDNDALVELMHGDLAATIREAVAGSTRLAQKAGVTLVVEAPEHAYTELDPTRVRLAVENLLRNALAVAPNGSAVTVTLVGPGAPAGQDETADWLITVRDHGRGFPPDFLPHAFERFRRSDPSRTRPLGPAGDVEGAGLGLAIVASVAHAHGGSVAAANAPDGGAILTVRLPSSPGGTTG